MLSFFLSVFLWVCELLHLQHRRDPGSAGIKWKARDADQSLLLVSLPFGEKPWI